MRPTVRSIGFIFLGFVAGAIFFIAMSTVLAWTGPSQTAPNGNVSAPINVGATDQIKNAGLGMNSLAVFGDSILQAASYLNWGTVSGSSGYGIRDNGGTIEFKNSGAGWSSLSATVTSAIQSFFASGSGNTVAQIKFADGTTQATAAQGGISQVTTATCSTWAYDGPCTATCPSGYYRTGCSVTAGVSGNNITGPRSAPSGAAASGTSSCSCTSDGTAGYSTCYAYCAK